MTKKSLLLGLGTLAVFLMMGAGCSSGSVCATDKYREDLNRQLVEERARLQTTAETPGESATVCEIQAALNNITAESKEPMAEARARCIHARIGGLSAMLREDDDTLLARMKVAASDPNDQDSKKMRIMLEACGVSYK